LNKEKGMTIVIVEHEVEVMATYADRIVVMHEGKIVMNDTPKAVLSQVDALAQVGTRPPQVTELAYALNKRGQAITDFPVTVEQAAQQLAALSL
jgi:ABC-type glutathione transport system ATPase component